MKKKGNSKKIAATSKKEEKNGGDVITVHGIGTSAAVAAGRGAKASIVTNTGSVPSAVPWETQIIQVINSSSDISLAEKEDLKQQVGKISDEIQKGSKAETGRLEKLINTLGIMAPDIFEVIVATLANPLTGMGLVIKKIGDKAKLEKTSSKG